MTLINHSLGFNGRCHEAITFYEVIVCPMERTYLKIIALSTMLLAAVSAFGQVSFQDSVKYSNQLIGIEQQLMDDMPSINTNWDKYMNPDCFVIAEDGTMYDKKAFLADFHQFPKGFSERIKVTKPKAVFHNNTGVINYVADEFEFIFGQTVHTTYSVMKTYIRNDTSWAMISFQIFEIPQLPQAIHVPVSVLNQYTGVYQLSDSNTCAITLQNDTLYIQKSGRSKAALFAETENVFFREADTRGRKLFVTDGKGAMLVVERRNGQDVVWRRIRR